MKMSWLPGYLANVEGASGDTEVLQSFFRNERNVTRIASYLARMDLLEIGQAMRLARRTQTQ